MYSLKYGDTRNSKEYNPIGSNYCIGKPSLIIVVVLISV